MSIREPKGRGRAPQAPPPCPARASLWGPPSALLCPTGRLSPCSAGWDPWGPLSQSDGLPHPPGMFGASPFMEPEGLLIHRRRGRAPWVPVSWAVLVPLGPSISPPEVSPAWGAGRVPTMGARSPAHHLPLPAGLAPCLGPLHCRPHPRPAEQPLGTSGLTPSPLPPAPPWQGTDSLGR